MSDPTKGANTAGHRVLGSGYEQEIRELKDKLLKTQMKLDDERIQRRRLENEVVHLRHLQSHIALHPYGACTCGGEGTCGWCLRDIALAEKQSGAAKKAFDQIAALTGMRQWDYPGQVVRDVELKLEAERGAHPRMRRALESFAERDSWVPSHSIHGHDVFVGWAGATNRRDPWKIAADALDGAQKPGPLVCGCGPGEHPPHRNYLAGGAEREGRVCSLGWPVR